MRLDRHVVEHAALFAAGEEAIDGRNRAGHRVRGSSARWRFDKAHDFSLHAAVLYDAAVGVAHAARVGPARSEDTVFGSDRIDVHVFRTVVTGEFLQGLSVSQDDVAIAVHDIGPGKIDGDPGSVAGLSALAPVA